MANEQAPKKKEEKQVEQEQSLPKGWASIQHPERGTYYMNKYGVTIRKPRFRMFTAEVITPSGSIVPVQDKDPFTIMKDMEES